MRNDTGFFRHGSLVKFAMSVGVMLVTVGIAWGTLNAEVTQLEKKQEKYDTSVESINKRLNQIERSVGAQSEKLESQGRSLQDFKEEQLRVNTQQLRMLDRIMDKLISEE